MKYTLLLTFAVLFLNACSSEVGSDGWCEDMKEKPKAEWSSDDAGSFAKHCVFK